MGRPKGSKNIKSFDAEILAHELGVDPLRILLYFASGNWEKLKMEEFIFTELPDGSVKRLPTITGQMRVEAAKSAVKYLYSAKNSLDIKAPDGIKIIIEDFSKKPEGKEEG